MKEKVLIVEDDPDARDAIKMHLVDDYEIFEASDGQEALDFIEKKRDIHIILLDLRLPVVTGTEVLTKIQDREDLRVIVLTAYPDEELNAIEAKELKVFSYLNKPVSRQPLRFAIDNAYKEIKIMRKRLKVLIVDEMLSVRNKVKHELDSLGFSFIEADSGEEALDLIRSKKIDLIILDIGLPGIDGIETLKRAKIIVPDLPPVIVLTDHKDIRTAVEAGKLGVFDFLLKGPISVDQLKDTVVKATSWGSKATDNIVKRCFKFGMQGCKYEIPVQKDLIFVGGPFSLSDVYKFGIKPAVESLGMKCYQPYEDKNNIDITCKICGSLQESKFAVMDVSGLNPNVFMEIGLAYGYGKIVILLKHKTTDMPTDLLGIEYIEYSTINSLEKQLKEYLEAILSG